jgi:hypothetical protein
MNELVQKWTAERTEMQEMLEALLSGNIRIGNPWENRSEAKIADLRRKISNLEQLIERENARGPKG